MGKLLAILNVFRKGAALSNAGAWKGGQVAANVAALVLALGTLSKAFGFDLGITDDQALAIGGGVAAVAAIANGLLTVATSDKVGLPPVAGSGSAGGGESGGDGEHESPSQSVEYLGG